jgi:DNA-binding NarL/FixJ family response regulator
VLRGPERPQPALAARLATALADTGARRREDLLRLATWRLEGGVTGPPELMAAAAWRAWASSDPLLAERLAIAAVDGGGGFEARFALALALRSQERFQEADVLLAELAPAARGRLDRVRMADARAAGLWGTGLTAEAEQMLLEAEGQASDRDARDQLAAIRAVVLAFSGRPAASLSVARPILARPATGDRARVRAGVAATIALCLAGGADEASALITELRVPALHVADELPQLPGQLLAAYTFTQTLAGRFEEVQDEAQHAYEDALASHASEPLAMWALTLGRIALGQGALPRARTLLREAAAIYAETDPPGLGAACLAVLSQVCAQSGDPAAAGLAQAQAEAAARPGFRAFASELGLARAWTAAAGSDLAAAHREALAVADTAQAAGHHAYAALALHELARLGQASATADRIARLGDTVDGPLIDVYVRHVAGLAADDGHELDQAASAFGAVGAHLLAAEAFAEACAAHRGKGRTASASRSATRASELVELCGRPLTPALAKLADVAVLTRREREVASLAADGLSNRAIAERLVVSVRTVEHHLEHAYQKLDVRRRSQLARHLGMPHT